MRSALFKATPLALMCWHVVTAAQAGVDVRTISEQNDRIVVQFDNHEPDGFEAADFFVAIATAGNYTAAYFRGSTPLSGLTVTPFTFRGSRILWIRATIPTATPVSRVEIDFAPATVVATAATIDPLVRELVVNETVFPYEPATGAPEPWFSRGAGWVKLAVTNRGMHAVSGADLATAGVNIGAIDPATVRVYTHMGQNQPREFVDPRGTWRPGDAMREVPIRVEAGNDGSVEPGDRVIFYGLGSRDWADYYDSTAPDSVFYEHTHALTNYYYLAWGGSLPGAPMRMADVDAAPVAGPDRTTYRHREYRERDLIADFDYRGDGWLWLDVLDSRVYNLATVTVSHLVSTVPQQFLSVGLAPYKSPASANQNHRALFRRGQAPNFTVIGDRIWDTQPGERFYENGEPIRITSNFLVPGDNPITFQVTRDLNPVDEQRFAWFALFYERRIMAAADATTFSTPDSSGALNMLARGFSTAGTLQAFDVTDTWNPSRLTGVEVAAAGGGRNVRMGFNLTGRRHVWAGSAFIKPGVTRLTPPDLRAETAPPTMLIVTHRDLRGAADRLRAWRAGGRVPLFANATVKVVTTDEIYDNFSGGLHDPMAIRNYIKYLFDNYPDANGHPRLAYVLLFGDATEDFQNRVSLQPDFVPAHLYFTRYTPFTFSTDDWYGHMDERDQLPGFAVLDVALGRLPAASADEAAFLVDRVIAYESEAPRDDWRQRAILVADDEVSSASSCEPQWTGQSNAIPETTAAEFLAFQKIFLTEYTAIAGVKPASRFDFIEAWNAGALVINYIGHGSSVQLADEQVFLGSDVSQLVNGLRLPLFMAYSCTVGDFANAAGKSLSERLLLREGGGAIATVTASRESYPGPNLLICYGMFEHLLPGRLGRDEHIPIGVALMRAKLLAQLDNVTPWQSFVEENSWKYNLLGDPAMRPESPRQPVRFHAAAPETLVAGLRHTLRGAVYRDGTIDSGFQGPVMVTVREPDIRRTYTCPSAGLSVDYQLPGGPIYLGTADAVDGRFEVTFRVPRYASTGTMAYAGAYAHDGDDDAAASEDSLLVIVPPTQADSLALQPVDGAPRVDLGFKSGLQVVKPGDTVQARVADGDGINILNTTNEGRQAILIDHLPVPIDVNEYFSFDHGGTDTTGVLLFPLPDLSVGRHRLVYKVSDSFGLTTLDTLQFDVTDAANYYAEAPFNYPNPFSDTTRFLFRISNRASIKLELFTISGKLVRRIQEVHEGGEAWVRWDGRDAWGGEVANGSYLYVATIDFSGVDRPPVVLRGALSRIR